eukprot:1403021-Rhodomonas_salina.2
MLCRMQGVCNRAVWSGADAERGASSVACTVERQDNLFFLSSARSEVAFHSSVPTIAFAMAAADMDRAVCEGGEGGRGSSNAVERLLVGCDRGQVPR